MCVCRIIRTQKRSWFLLPGFVFNLYSYNRNTVTETGIDTSLCWDIIISIQEYDYNLLSYLLLLHFSENGIHVFHSLNVGYQAKYDIIFTSKQCFYY